MPIDKDSLKKLSPEDRIKKLKELEEERKKEIKEAEDLIKKTEAELLHNKEIPNIDVPELEPVDISKIFESPEGLETTVRKEVDSEDTAEIKYTPSGYDTEVASLWEPNANKIKDDERLTKIEETIKYESAADKSDPTASRSLLKQIKKYTSG